MTRNQLYARHIAQVVSQRYGEDVCLLAAYGSFVNGTENALSDVDLYFVPATHRAMELCRTFLIEGVGYDLFPMTWERLQRIADFDDPLAPLVGQARLLYVRSPEDAARFEALRYVQQAHLQDADFMARAARARLDQAITAFGQLCLESRPGPARARAGEVLMLLADACAYANGRYFTRGLKTQPEDLAALPSLPDGFLPAYHGAVAARGLPDLRSYCRRALRATSAFLDQRGPTADGGVRGELLADLLRESISTFNKLHVCAQTGNAPLAFLSACCLQGALDEMAQEAGAPTCDLLSGFDAEDLPALDTRAQRILARLTRVVECSGAGLHPYATIEDFLSDFPSK